jgi:hypothetical protein
VVPRKVTATGSRTPTLPTTLSRSLCKLSLCWLWRGRGEPVGVGEGSEGWSPALDAGSFDEPVRGLTLVAGKVLLSLARARARLSSMSRMAIHSSLMTASSVGKRPRFLMILWS